MPADGFQMFMAFQPFAQRDKVNRLIAVVQIEDPLVDDAMGFAVEIFRAQQFDGARDRFALEQHGAKRGLLGLDALRWYAF